MSAQMTLAQRYFDAWNAHDAAAIVETFAPGGIYHDPTSGGPLTGEAIGHYAAGLWSAFPDLQFELQSAGMMGEGCLAAQWVMRGTNAGSMLGLPPTGRFVELAGADFIALDAAGIRSVTGYFDSAEMPRQLGLQTVVQPHQLGPFTFGVSNCVQSGNTATPHGLAFTCLVARDEEEKEKVRTYGRQISQEMLNMPGLISSMGIGLGSRMLTLSTWETDDQPQQLMRGGIHREAMRHFYNETHYLGGFTSVWKPVRFTFSARCEQCGRMHRESHPIEQCTCGAALSSPANLW